MVHPLVIIFNRLFYFSLSLLDTSQAHPHNPANASHSSTATRKKQSAIQTLEGNLEDLLGTVKYGLQERDKALQSAIALLAERDNENTDFKSKLLVEKQQLARKLEEKEAEYLKLESAHKSSEENWKSRESKLLHEISTIKQKHLSEIAKLNASLQERDRDKLANANEIKILQDDVHNYTERIASLQERLKELQKQCQIKDKEADGLKRQTQELQNNFASQSAKIPLLQQQLIVLHDRLKEKETEHLETTRALLREKEEKEHVVQERLKAEKQFEEARKQTECLLISLFMELHHINACPLYHPLLLQWITHI